MLSVLDYFFGILVICIVLHVQWASLLYVGQYVSAFHWNLATCADVFSVTSLGSFQGQVGR